MKGYNDSNIFNKLKIICKIIFNRNDIICHDYNRKAKKGIVNLNYWRIDEKNDTDNLGDYLSYIVYEYMLNRKGISIDKKVEQTKHLYSIGSILFTGFQDATVWGSGTKEKLKGVSGKITLFFNKYFRKLDIRAVRGPITRKYLIENNIRCPEVYGDPAILMPIIYKSNVSKKTDYVIINHYTKYNGLEKNMINLKTKDYKKVIDKICEAKLVISGSLHGIILAEAYGVPAILLKDREDFSDWKYKDYYLSTGREEFPIVNSIEEALKTTPPEIPSFEKITEDLIKSFPYDLWD